MKPKTLDTKLMLPQSELYVPTRKPRDDLNYDLIRDQDLIFKNETYEGQGFASIEELLLNQSHILIEKPP
jgi:hypothetical protein